MLHENDVHCTIFESFDVEYYHDFEIWVRRKLESSKLGVLFTFHSNYMALSCVISKIMRNIG